MQEGHLTARCRTSTSRQCHFKSSSPSSPTDDDVTALFLSLVSARPPPCDENLHIMLRGSRVVKIRPRTGLVLTRALSTTTGSDSAMSLVRRAAEHARADRLAMVDPNGASHSYADLLRDSGSISRALRASAGGDADLGEKTVAFLCPSDSTYAHVQWGVWRAGGVAVPLSPKHPKDELDYFLGDSDAALVVGHRKYESVLRPVAEAQGRAYIDYDALVAGSEVLDGDDAPIAASDLPSRASHIIYTSGTTGRPKGVVTTHAALEAQVGDLCSSWGWTAEDRILHFLPLHHVHGIVNKWVLSSFPPSLPPSLPPYLPPSLSPSLSPSLPIFLPISLSISLGVSHPPLPPGSPVPCPLGPRSSLPAALTLPRSGAASPRRSLLRPPPLASRPRRFSWPCRRSTPS